MFQINRIYTLYRVGLPIFCMYCTDASDKFDKIRSDRHVEYIGYTGPMQDKTKFAPSFSVHPNIKCHRNMFSISGD
jgi:hypothetical protein